jgi:hypothetical protein
MKLLSLIIIVALFSGCIRHTQVMPMSGITYSSTDPSPAAYSPKAEDPNTSTGDVALMLLGTALAFGLLLCYMNYLGSSAAASSGNGSPGGMCSI